jgi:molecular chaperone HscB
MTSFDRNFAQLSHFALFDLPQQFELDRAELERRYQEIQGQVHPDRFAGKGDAERRIAMQWATQTNEARQVLSNPLSRARYLLELTGHDARIETNTAMPAEFLIQQMEWRETVAEARAAGDESRLAELEQELRITMKQQYVDLAQALDERHDFGRASEIVRQLMFQEKLINDIDDALEALES